MSDIFDEVVFVYGIVQSAISFHFVSTNWAYDFSHISICFSVNNGGSQSRFTYNSFIVQYTKYINSNLDGPMIDYKSFKCVRHDELLYNFKEMHTHLCYWFCSVGSSGQQIENGKKLLHSFKGEVHFKTFFVDSDTE